MSELGNTRAQTGVVGLARSKALDGVDGHSWITHAPSEQNLARVVTGLAGLQQRPHVDTVRREEQSDLLNGTDRACTQHRRAASYPTPNHHQPLHLHANRLTCRVEMPCTWACDRDAIYVTWLVISVTREQRFDGVGGGGLRERSNR